LLDRAFHWLISTQACALPDYSAERAAPQWAAMAPPPPADATPDPPSPALDGPSPSPPRPPASRVGATVAVDVGARRLWLSDTIRFRGNVAEILEESYPLVDTLAKALRSHPGICVRLEGHTNSACGLSCDGTTPCSNARCASLFAGKGGAVGASLARARAVEAALVARDGADADRIVAIGLAGSRRLVDDTNGPGNHRNRRVEVHTLDF